MDVELPNGVLIQGIPDGTSKDVIMQKAISGGYAQAVDFETDPVTASLEQQNNMEYQETQDDVEYQAYEQSLTSGPALPEPVQQAKPQEEEEFGRYLDISFSIESTKDYNAYNEDSGAAGGWQFLESTWDLFVDKYEPELRKGREKKEVYDLRYDPVISRRMAGRMAKENATAMRKNNIPVDETNLYIMHFLGMGTGLDVLKGNRNQPLSKVMSKTAIKRNQSVVDQAKTVGGLLKWANKKVKEHGSKL